MADFESIVKYIEQSSYVNFVHVIGSHTLESFQKHAKILQLSFVL